MELSEIVMKIVGPVEPVGCSSTDKERLKNAVMLTSLIEDLLVIVNENSRYANSYEDSVKTIGNHFKKFGAYLISEDLVLCADSGFDLVHHEKDEVSQRKYSTIDTMIADMNGEIQG